ncbi:mechanosensitive ion channel protein MscS [Pontibacter sp. MBLB2868]|uniref:mechanosensitive ion channel protein MscS n=1 Tax=Pontibacter sp. MBLB2868 TaxID=3451555 RepID=UPI003F752B7F
MIKNIIYAILLGVGMAACLSQQNKEEDQSTAEAPDAAFLDTSETNIPENTAPDPSNFVISKERVGSVTIGMPIEQMRQQVPVGYTIADTTLTQEGMQYTAYLLHPKDQDKGILIEQNCDKECFVWRINVKSPAYKTPKGVGIGSKYGEIQRLYPISTVTLADGGFVAVAKEGGISFVLDQSQLPRERLASFTPENLPANTLVKSILIY